MLGRDHRLRRGGRERQPDRKHAASIRSVASRVDRAAVQLDERPRNRQPEAEAALLAIEPALTLDEQVEHARYQIGPHAQHFSLGRQRAFSPSVSWSAFHR